MRTIDQELAEAAYNRVLAYKDSPERKKYGAMAHKLPILVRTAGLAESLAFVESRGKGPQLNLLEDLAQVVSAETRDVFAEKSRTVEMQEYIFRTRRTLLALKWFKRFAQSVLGVEATEEGDMV